MGTISAVRVGTPMIPASHTPQHPKKTNVPTHALQAHDHYQKNDFPWSFKPSGPLSSSLLSQVHSLSKEDKASLEKDMALLSALGLPESMETDPRAPHHIIRSALALALKDKHIDVTEATELRSLLLGLPVKERNKYQSLLQNAPMSPLAQPILHAIDEDMSKYEAHFSKAEIALMDSASFKLVFPNFNQLNMFEKRQVVTELQPFLKHFPNLLPKLNQINNDNYGTGFQYFFVPKGANQHFDHVIPKNMAGVIMPGASVVKDPVLGLLVKKVSLRMLDRGGMYTSSIPHGVFTHEFAHVIHLNMLNDDQRDTVKNLYDKAWNADKSSKGQKGFVTAYAKTNPYEYFAEGVEYYYTGSQDKLKAKDPQLHAFLKHLFAQGKVYSGKDGNLFTDPERVHILTSHQGGRTLVGASISRESDLFSIKNFEGGIVTEGAVMGGSGSAIGRASLGVKAAWKPTTQPIGLYGTAGAVVQAGVLNEKLSVGAGGFVGAGVDYKHFNVEVRRNFMGGINTPSSTEVRAGLRFEF